MGDDVKRPRVIGSTAHIPQTALAGTWVPGPSAPRRHGGWTRPENLPGSHGPRMRNVAGRTHLPELNDDQRGERRRQRRQVTIARLPRPRVIKRRGHDCSQFAWSGRAVGRRGAGSNEGVSDRDRWEESEGKERRGQEKLQERGGRRGMMEEPTIIP